MKWTGESTEMKRRNTYILVVKFKPRNTTNCCYASLPTCWHTYTHSQDPDAHSCHQCQSALVPVILLSQEQISLPRIRMDHVEQKQDNIYSASTMYQDFTCITANQGLSAKQMWTAKLTPYDVPLLLQSKQQNPLLCISCVWMTS